MINYTLYTSTWYCAIFTGPKFWHTSKIIRAITETNYFKLEHLRNPCHSEPSTSGNRASPLVVPSDSDSDEIRPRKSLSLRRKRPQYIAPELSDSDTPSQLPSSNKYVATTDVHSLLVDIKENVTKFRVEMEQQMKLMQVKDQITLAAVFTCIICKEVSLEEKAPLMPTCCRNIVCCRDCLNQWLSSSSQCPHCRQGITIDQCVAQPILRPLFALLDQGTSED